MTSRLYRTTRPLAAQVTLMLRRLGIERVGILFLEDQSREGE